MNKQDHLIKIVFLCRGYGTVNRGVESHVEELSKRLKDYFEVSVFAGKDADDLGKIIKGKFDLVIPANGRLQALRAGIGRIIGGYKTLIVAHAGIGRDEIWNLLTMPNIYVALTEKEISWAKNFALLSGLVKIPNGIDLEKFKPEGKKKNLGLDNPVILSVGALEWYKHHDLVIKAVAKLPNTSLLIVGEGSQKKELESLGRQLLGEKRFKIIKSDYLDMPEVYRGGDLFTLPSWDREAFGIVYLEAMATGLAIVAPNDSARKEIVGDAGILTDPVDTDVYAKALNDALAKKWGSIPRDQAKKFSWEKITNDYKELILKICK